MKRLSAVKDLDGREAQFEEMMQRFDEIHARYKGVRGELLAKVRAELMALKPGRAPAAPANDEPAPAPSPAPPRTLSIAPSKMLPSCRMCGRGMKQQSDGTLVCERGHIRLAS